MILLIKEKLARLSRAFQSKLQSYMLSNDLKLYE